MANSWRREKTSSSRLLVLLAATLIAIYILFIFLSPSSYPENPNCTSPKRNRFTPFLLSSSLVQPFDCDACPQASPVFASLVEGVPRPFMYSLADFGVLPEKPHKNIARLLKGKPFRRPEISATVQELLDIKRKDLGPSIVDDGIVVDVGANVGMATFAASAMGFRVVAFEPVFENLQRICDGIFLNRAAGRVTVFAAAASDEMGNITVHKLVGRLDNSAVSATGAKLAFKSNKEIAFQVPSVTLDSIIPDSTKVLLLKIDVQGWEYHVLRGASKLLSRKDAEAPYLIYEEDDRLLVASNSTKESIRNFLATVGYRKCVMQNNDAHCVKS